MLPVSAIITGWLIAGRAWYLAVRWTSFFVMAVAVVVITKVAFLGWGIGIRALDFTGISGHTMLAATIFPITAHLLLLDKPRDLWVTGIVCASAVALAVGLSRYVLGAHSPSEIVAGLGLGAGVAATVIGSSQRMETPVLHAPTLGAALILTAFLTYGHALDTQHLMIKIALEASGRDHPYSRITWR